MVQKQDWKTEELKGFQLALFPNSGQSCSNNHKIK